MMNFRQQKNSNNNKVKINFFLSFFLGLFLISLCLENDDVVAQEISKEETRYEASNDESIYIVQPRNYSKKGKLEFNPMFYSKINPRFVSYWGGSLALGIHFSENINLELISSVYQSTNLSDFVYEINTIAGNNFNAPLRAEWVDYKKMTYWAGANLHFSALYGKFDFFKRPIDYDLYLISGFGFAKTKDPCLANSNQGSSAPVCQAIDTGFDFVDPPTNPLDGGEDGTKITATLGAGFRLFFSENVGLKFEVRDLVFSDRNYDPTVEPKTTFDIRNNINFSLGLSFMTPSVFGPAAKERKKTEF